MSSPEFDGRDVLKRVRIALLVLINLNVMGIAIPSVVGMLAGRSRLGELATHCAFNFLLLSSVALIAALVLLSWRTAIVPIALVALHSFAVLPFYLDRPMQPNSSKANLRVATMNIVSGHADTGVALAFLREVDADVISVQELTPELQRALLSIADLYPHRREEPRVGVFGIGLYSRLPLANARVVDMAGDGTPSIVAEVRVNDQDVTIVACHTRPPVSCALFRARNAELAELAKFGRETKAPLILAGDLNVTMWSPYYNDLRNESGLRNVRRGYGVKGTWPVGLSIFKIPIDHILVSQETMVVDLDRGPDIGSDHLPLIADLHVSAPPKVIPSAADGSSPVRDFD